MNHPRCRKGLVAVFAGVLTAVVAAPSVHAAASTAELPAVLDAGTTMEVPVTLRNSGDVIWSPEAGFALSYHWLAEDGITAVVWDGVRSPFPRVVSPGEEVVVTARLAVPADPGRYVLQWDVVQEGRFWLSERDGWPGSPSSVEVAASHGFAIEQIEMPVWAWAGSTVSVPMELQNRGAVQWQADGRFAVASHWRGADGEVAVWEGLRKRLPRAVAEGDSLAVTASVQIPDQGGRHLLQWDMVEDGECWFSERSAPSAPWVVVAVPGRWLPQIAVAFTLLMLAAASATVAGRWQGPAPAVGVFDLLWLLPSLFLKQWTVLAEAGEWPRPEAGALACFGVAVLALALVTLPVRWRPWAVWLAAAFGTVLVHADLLYLRFFGDIPSLVVLRAAEQAIDVRASVASLWRVEDLWLWADLVLAVPLIVVARRAAARDDRSARPLAAALLAMLAAVSALWAVASSPARSTALSQVFRNIYVAREIGVLNFHALDLVMNGAGALLRPDLDRADIEEVEAYFERTSGSRAGQGPLFRAAADANLLMVQVESLQAFVIGLTVEGREVTPTLNRWARSSLWFSDVTDQTEQGRSSDSELLTQASLLPTASGAAAFSHGDNRFTGLAAVLREHGYTTLSAVPFDGTFWNRRNTHPGYGYDTNLFVDDFAPAEEIGWGLNDRAFFEQMAPVLAGLEQPFCAWLITLSLHHPFSGFPAAHKHLDVGEWEGTPVGNYLHTMHFFDRALAELEAGLERDGLLGNTVVTLWGDHDAGFAWRPDVAELMGVRPDAAGWYRSQQVPLIIRLPGEGAPTGEIDIPAGHVDVAPTVLALLGVDAAPLRWIGRNLLGEPGDEPVVGEYRCWTDGRHIFLQRGARLEDGECLDRRSLDTLDVQHCASGYRAANTQVRVSRWVLEHDLQSEVATGRNP